MSRETRDRVAECEQAITDITRRLTALEARSPGQYPLEPPNDFPPPPLGGTTDEED